MAILPRMPMCPVFCISVPCAKKLQLAQMKNKWRYALQQHVNITQQHQTTQIKGLEVTLSIQSEQFVLRGSWKWNMQAEAVYCSDVMG